MWICNSLGFFGLALAGVRWFALARLLVTAVFAFEARLAIPKLVPIKGTNLLILWAFRICVTTDD
jgi:hypothetical protein